MFVSFYYHVFYHVLSFPAKLSFFPSFLPFLSFPGKLSFFHLFYHFIISFLNVSWKIIHLFIIL